MLCSRLKEEGEAKRARRHKGGELGGENEWRGRNKCELGRGDKVESRVVECIECEQVIFSSFNKLHRLLQFERGRKRTRHMPRGLYLVGTQDQRTRVVGVHFLESLLLLLLLLLL